MSWECVETEIDGKTAIVLVDVRFLPALPVTQLPRLHWIGVWNLRPAGSGLWDPDESDSLDALEDTLVQALGELSNGWATYVLRVCTRGIREFYVYAAPHVQFGGLLDMVRATHPEYRVELDATDDPGWGVYRKYAVLA